MNRIPVWTWVLPIVVVIAIGLYLAFHKKADAEDSPDEASSF